MLNLYQILGSERFLIRRDRKSVFKYIHKFEKKNALAAWELYCGESRDLFYERKISPTESDMDLSHA
jgi:hypothetical protein